MLDFSDSPKRATNLTLNARMLDLARELDINLSQTVDRLLAEEVRRRYRDRWLERNKDAIDEYNARIGREGSFSDRYRTFLKPSPKG
jgi:antitoxin CcdA